MNDYDRTEKSSLEEEVGELRGQGTERTIHTKLLRICGELLKSDK